MKDCASASVLTCFHWVFSALVRKYASGDLSHVLYFFESPPASARGAAAIIMQRNPVTVFISSLLSLQRLISRPEPPSVSRRRRLPRISHQGRGGPRAPGRRPNTSSAPRGTA